MSSKQIRRPNFLRGGTSPQTSPNPSRLNSSPSPTLSPPPTVEKPKLDSRNTPIDDFILPFMNSQPSLFDSGNLENNLSADDDCTETKCVYDLTFHLTAYDGTPIIIVPEGYFDVVAQSFTAGMYGFDTESDCQNGELRIIQIYTGKEVYIFPAKALDRLKDNYLVKFLKAKDRLKLGADIDTDCYRLRRHVNMRKSQGHFDQKLKYKFTVNGAIDLQSIARSLGETIMGLEDLALKYVDGFEGNPSNLGSYCPPTDQQYIYAANDAIVSLKIYQLLIHRKPTEKWLQLNRPVSLSSDEEVSDQENDAEEVIEIVEVQDPVDAEIQVDESKSEEPLNEESADEPDTPIIREKLVISTEMTEVKSKRKRKGKKNKKPPTKKSPIGKHEYKPRDEIEEALRTIDQLAPASKAPKAKTQPTKFSIPDIEDELKVKLRQRVDKLKQHRVNPISLKTTSFREMKALLNQERTTLKDNLEDVNDVISQVRELFDAGVKKTTLIRSGERFRTFKDMVVEDDRLTTETVDRMMAIEKELTDQEYYDSLSEVAVYLLKKNIETIEYGILLNFMINDLKTINKKYAEKTDRILAANIMINMALDNNCVETVSKTPTSFIGNGVNLRLVR
jgi:hypothetical protein